MLLDNREICNCTSAYFGLTCSFKVAVGQLNPCDDLACHNGGICQGYSTPNDKDTLTGKCICPKHRAGRNCEKPNLCVDRCLNGGMCRWSDDDTSVSCICRKGFKGDRCQIKDKDYNSKRRPPSKQIDNDEEVSGDVVKIVASILGAVATIAAVVGVAFFCRRRKLAEAFKHRRMAESLVNGGGTNMEFPNQVTKKLFNTFFPIVL